MPVTYKVFENPPLVYVQYSGHVVTQDIVVALANFANEGAAPVGQPHLFDLSRTTSQNIDFTDFFHLFGDLAEVYPSSSGEHLFVFYAPDGPPADLAQILRRPFSESKTMLVRLAQTKEQAFDILGGPHPDVLKELNPPA